MRFFGKRLFWFSNSQREKSAKDIQVTRNEVNLETPGVPVQNGNFKKRSTLEEKPIKNGDTELDMHESDKYSKPKRPHWLTRRIYILTWIRQYDREKAMSDLIAGITLGLTIIPQGLAYATLARVPSEVGLYSAFIGSIIYVFFGTIPQVSIGPTSLMAILVLQYCDGKPFNFVVVLAFLAGLVEFLMGVFKLGFLCSFIPNPVTKAFTTGTATIIASVQLKSLLGIGGKGFPSPSQIWNGIKLGDSIVGFLCIAVLLSLRLLSDVKFKRQNETTRRWKKFLWYISISRNAIVVFICAAITYIWINQKSKEAIPYGLTLPVKSGLPNITVPPFAFEANNRTYIFTDILHELGSSIFVVPLVAALSNVAIAKAFVKDGSLDASQEMLTLGICNIAGSFVGAMPTCGAFTRSAVSNASGVRTPMAGIYTGIVVLSALSILTEYFQYIPKSALAAVLIAAVIFMIEIRVVRHYWRNNKKDFFSWTGCFIACLVAGVEKGLLIGVIINMIFILMRLGSPKLSIELKELNGQHYIHMVPKSDVYYTAVDLLRDEMRSALAMYRNDFPLVIDCVRFMQFDATFVDMFNGMVKEMKENDVLFVIQRMSPKYQPHINESSNLRFCDNDELTLEDLMPKE